MDKIIWVHKDSLSCEAIVREAPDGHLILVSQCGGEDEPRPENRVYVFHSRDGGETWTKPVLITPDNGRATYATEVSVIGNRVDVFITEHDGSFLYPDCYILRSEDNGETWRKVPLPVFENTFVFIRGRVDFPDGKIAYPYQQYELTEAESARLHEEGKILCAGNIGEVRCGLILSEDGERFVKSEDVVVKNEWDGKRVWQWPEPTAVVLSDGSLAMLLRINGAGYLFRTDSFDGGMSWKKPYRTEIPNPNNKPKLIPLGNGDVALLNTPNPKTGFKYRTPLEVWISSDGLRTWRYRKRVSDFPGWLSYPDGFATRDGKEILFAFELNRHDVYFVRCDISDYRKENP